MYDKESVCERQRDRGWASINMTASTLCSIALHVCVWECACVWESECVCVCVCMSVFVCVCERDRGWPPMILVRVR